MAGTFFDSPDWFTADANTQASVLAQEFNKTLGQSEKYQNADATGKAEYESAYKRLIEERASKSPNNPKFKEARDAQTATNIDSTLSNLVSTSIRSHQEALSLAPIFPQIANIGGKFDDKYYQQSAVYYEKQQLRPQTESRKKIDTDLASWGKSFDHGDGLNKITSSLKLIGDFVTNPEGVMQVGAESIATMTSMLIAGKAGGLAGGAIGAAVGGPAAPATAATGAAIGTTAGVISASTAHSGAMKFLDMVELGMLEEGLEPTPSNIKMFIETNPERIQQYQKDAATYGTAMGVADAVTGGALGKLMSAPTRAALQAGRASALTKPAKAAIAEAAEQSGKSIEEATEIFINNAARNNLKNQSFKSKLGHASGGYVGEIASEPLTEAIATTSIGEELSADELIMEAIGGVGAGPIGSAVNVSLFGSKIAGDKTKDFTKKILASTPESRTIADQQRQKLEEAKAQYDSDIKGKSFKDVEETDPRDVKVDAWADPKNKDYDPVKAVKVLAKAEDLDTELIDKARKVQNDFRAHILEIGQEIGGLIEKRQVLTEAGQDTTNISAQIDRAEKILNVKKLTFNDVSAQVTMMKNRDQAAAQSKEITPIDPETATPEEVSRHITDSLGSSGNKFAATDEHIEKLLGRKDLAVEDVTVLKNMKDANAARKLVVENAKIKTADEVANDIYHGVANSDFKGIDAYQRGISNHTESGRIPEAQKQLDGLIKFRDDHQQKYDAMVDIFETMKTAKDKNNPESALSPTQLATYRDMQAKAKVVGKAFSIHPIKSHNLIPMIGQEVAALNAEVKLAESVIEGKQSKIKATPSPKVSSAPTIDPDVKETKNGNLSEVPRVGPAWKQVSPVREDVAVEETAKFAKNVFSITPKQSADKKASVKASIATQFIGFGEGIVGKNGITSSTEDYREQAGQYANTGNYSEQDVIFVSVPGLRGNETVRRTQQNRTIKEAAKALEAGATLITDNKDYVESSKYNEGERRLAQYLTSKGYQYSERTVNGQVLGVWRKNAATPTSPINSSSSASTEAPATPSTTSVDQDSTPETKEVTDEQIAASFSGNIEDLPVTYVDAHGATVENKPYKEAIQDIDAEIQEAKNILDCFSN